MVSRTALKLQPDQWEALETELQFKTSRGGGPGGQSVNKLETRVELLLDIANSQALSEMQILHLLARTDRRLNSGGQLRIVCAASRSQLANKQTTMLRLKEWLEQRLTLSKQRIATRPSRSSRENRIQTKKKQSERKQSRKRVDPKRDL